MQLLLLARRPTCCVYTPWGAGTIITSCQRLAQSVHRTNNLTQPTSAADLRDTCFHSGKTHVSQSPIGYSRLPYHSTSAHCITAASHKLPRIVPPCLLSMVTPYPHLQQEPHKPFLNPYAHDVSRSMLCVYITRRCNTNQQYQAWHMKLWQPFALSRQLTP